MLKAISKRLKFSLFFFLVLAGCLAFAQTPAEKTLLADVVVNDSTNSIFIYWNSPLGANAINIYRRTSPSQSWGPIIATMPNGANAYNDTNVTPGVRYEYRLQRVGSVTGECYISAGINCPAIEYRGKIMLLVDVGLADSLTLELFQLEQDLIGDGWQVIRHDISTALDPPNTKSFINAAYNADSLNLKAVLIIGHLAVPYSGNIYPDGHPDHQGAWPADVYYADMNGNWTDTQVYANFASNQRNWNFPGDGKFDQDEIPSSLELQVGRVDLSQISNFGDTYIGLTRRYLSKLHDYRFKNAPSLPRVLIDDNLGCSSVECLGVSGYRTASALTGFQNIANYDFATYLTLDSYQWSFGTGGGSYASCNGVVNSSQFAQYSFKTNFAWFIGSYFGDWDYPDNLLRAALAANGNCLASGWVGRPGWFFHHMAMGENLGYSVKLTQNNLVDYETTYGQRMVHIGLMGDPTIRQHVLMPARNALATTLTSTIKLEWERPLEDHMGFYVYRLNPANGRYARISPFLVTDTFFVDASPYNGANYYMIRSVGLESASGGSYLNLGQGVFCSALINLLSVGLSLDDEFDFRVFPNPTAGFFNLTISAAFPASATLRLRDLSGRICMEKTIVPSMPGEWTERIDISALAAGMYVVELNYGTHLQTKKIIAETQVLR
jgi:hypothetical protein